MNFVIPMAGIGKRFAEAGYSLPKPLIEAKGKTLLQWSLDSLPLQLCTNLIFVILQTHEDEFSMSAKICSWYGTKHRLHFIFLPHPTRGQAETVWMARKAMHPDAPLLIFNIDTRFTSGTLWQALQRTDIDGVLGAFIGRSPRFSFAKTGRDGFVEQVAEKKVISRNALTGLYHFRRTSDFLRSAEHSIRNELRENGEFFVAPLYQQLIAEGKRFVLDFCSTHDILGTPAELHAFQSSPEDRK